MDATANQPPTNNPETNQMSTYQMESNANIAELNAAQDVMDDASKACTQACAAMKAAHLTVKECGQLRLWLSGRKEQDDNSEHTWHLMRMVNDAASIAATEARATVNRTRRAYNDACTSYETLAGPRY